MSFVNAHFVTYARDLGYHPMVAAGAFSLIGATAIIGALYLGNMSDNRGRRRWLAISYQLRLVGFVVVLLSMGVSFAGLPAFGLAPLLIGVLLVGFSWNAVVGITAAYASDGFGLRNLGKIYGTMFAVMPIGSGIGAYLSGVLYDQRGNYEVAIWSNIVLLALAAILVLSIGDRRPGESGREPVEQGAPA
jgi:MFS family permease